MSTEGHLERIRREELMELRGLFSAGARVVELGGGSGYQAGLIKSWGCRICSLDLPDGEVRQTYHTVIQYDGSRIPCKDAQFDIVFSSNVLEHVRNLPAVFSELRRILKPDGLMVHILPSSSWRLWTTVGHYPNMARMVYGWRSRFRKNGFSSDSTPPGASHKASAPRPGIGTLIRNVLVPGPHGEYPNALAELYYFSRSRWIREFARHRLDVIHMSGNHLFYTGNMLFPGLRLSTRRRLSRYFGSACNIFILRRRSSPTSFHALTSLSEAGPQTDGPTSADG